MFVLRLLKILVSGTSMVGESEGSVPSTNIDPPTPGVEVPTAPPLESETPTLPNLPESDANQRAYLEDQERPQPINFGDTSRNDRTSRTVL